INLMRFTSSSNIILKATDQLFTRIVNPQLLVRRLNIVAAHIQREAQVKKEKTPVQLNLFTDYEAERERKAWEERYLAKERQRQELILSLQKKFGKNVILKGINFADGATQKLRNRQIGGHQA
ncbi:MAG: DNA methylase, partial [Muribaculaceae bacterium]|nr:DNA methylase [Muribaculaceae bacterium]